MLRSLWRYRGFVAASVRREMRVRYAGSAFGAAWQIVTPLAMIAIYSIVFADLMKARLPGVEDRFAYAIYVCSGLLAWNMFAEMLQRAQTMFVDSANLLKKASFPRSCVPAVVAVSALTNFAIVYGVFMGLLALSGRWPGLVAVTALAPLALLALIGVAFGVLIGIANVFFRDVAHVLAIVLQLMFWLTPVVYPLSVLPQGFLAWIERNPLVPVVTALQDVFVRASPPVWSTLAYPLVVAVGMTIVSVAVFRRQAPWIVDEL